ncbi:MAG: hypothetical protein AB8B96_00840 [Lysobacterales bacterium]
MKCLGLMVFCLLTSVVVAAPLESRFSYQGELRSAGKRASGRFDLTFEVFDVADGGTGLTAPLDLNNVLVTNGVFTVELDFGLTPFAGDQLWLAIAVKPAGDPNPAAPLLPRQPINAVPYAQHAQFVAEGAVGAGELAMGAVNAAAINSDEVQQRVSGSCQPGSAITAIASDGQVTCETSADDDWLVTSDFVSTARSVGIGGATSNVASGSLTVQDYSDTSSNPFGGMYVDVQRSSDEKPFYGYAISGFPAAFTEYDGPTGQFRIWTGDYDFVQDSQGRIGLSNLNPQRTLDVGGAVRVADLTHSGQGNVAVMVEPDGDLVLAQSGELLYHSIPSSAFVEGGTSTPSRRTGTVQTSLRTTVDNLNYLVAPLQLPQGAVVRDMVFYYVDNSLDELRFSFFSNEHATTDSDTFFSRLSSGSSSAIRSMTFDNVDVDIDNQTSSYQVIVNVNSANGINLLVRSVMVAYTLQ